MEGVDKYIVINSQQLSNVSKVIMMSAPTNQDSTLFKDHNYGAETEPAPVAAAGLARWTNVHQDVFASYLQTQQELDEMDPLARSVVKMEQLLVRLERF